MYMLACGKDSIDAHNVERTLYLLIPRHYLELNTLAHGSALFHFARAIMFFLCVFDACRNDAKVFVASLGSMFRWLLVLLNSSGPGIHPLTG